jgi:HAMP domain-containing protein
MPGENGKTVPYSQDLAKMLLNDPELKELRDEINEFAGEFDSFKQEVEKELEKN